MTLDTTAARHQLEQTMNEFKPRTRTHEEITRLYRFALAGEQALAALKSVSDQAPQAIGGEAYLVTAGVFYQVRAAIAALEGPTDA
jgi:hypothetical protein